jgi:glutaredoxin-like protein NrdH
MNKAAAEETVVTVFSAGRACVQCNATTRWLDSHGIEYRVIEVAADDEDTRAQLRELGFMQFPIVRSEVIAAFSGFRPDKLDELAEAVAR